MGYFMERNSIPRSILVAGGGTAGWMTAVFLQRIFEELSEDQPSISLIESEVKGAIGVGEATVHTLRQFLRALSVPEGEFMSKTDATLKHGILFRDWAELPNGSKRGIRSCDP